MKSVFERIYKDNKWGGIESQLIDHPYRDKSLLLWSKEQLQ